MQQPMTKFPFSRICYGQQPFGLRVQCVLDPSLVPSGSLLTGLAIEATGGMESYFGMGPFSKGVVKEIGQRLGEFLGKIDKQGGTSIVYWGTDDTDMFQSLGFRCASEWGFFSFGRPSNGFGRKGLLCPALNYFLEDTYLKERALRKSDLEGIFVFLLDGGIDDYAKALDYVGQFADDVIANRRTRKRLIFVGLGERFIEASHGQIQALASYSQKTNPPVITSLVVKDPQTAIEQIKDALMQYLKLDKPGILVGEKGNIIQDYSDGLPGAFQFYLPTGSHSFLLNMDGNQYWQQLN